jgi:hypothetical protein
MWEKVSSVTAKEYLFVVAHYARIRRAQEIFSSTQMPAEKIDSVSIKHNQNFFFFFFTFKECPN